ncbi:ComEA family DNA-binding protein [Vibrio sp. WJH972]
MKAVNLGLVLILSLFVGLTTVPTDAYAASTKETAEKKLQSTEKSTKSSTKSTKSTTKSTSSNKSTNSTKKSTKSTTKSTASKSPKKAPSKPININTANEALLIQLPGVGPATAKAIIKHRKANGKFKKANDLLNVKGIGDKTFKKMKSYVKI